MVRDGKVNDGNAHPLESNAGSLLIRLPLAI